MNDPATSLGRIAVACLKAGWHPIELPAGAKGPPPEGRTGHGGSDMTAAEVVDGAWLGNLGVRMPVDVIGLDVDVYRGGGPTLARLIDELGELPATTISHNGRDDGSGIRFYRVPPGLAWLAGLAGLDVIQRTHRYAVVAPSVHPDRRRYSWLDPAGEPTEIVPPVEDLPELPWPWIARLSRAHSTEVASSSTAVDADGLTEFLAAHTEAEQPSYITTICAHFTDRRAQGYSRHDTMQHCLIWAMECCRAGIASAAPVTDLLAAIWSAAVSPDERRAEIRSPRRVTEFEAMLRHAVGRVMAKPEAAILKLHDDIAGIPMRPSTSTSTSTSTSSTSSTSTSSELIDVYQHELLDSLPAPIDWHAFANRTESDREWLVEGFWPWGRSIALWAAAKTGKSELALWCAVKLALGEHPWNGHPIEPVDVGYFDFEMTEDDLDDRLAAFGFDPARLGRLHYFLLPALHALDGEQGGAEVEALTQRHGLQAVVLDTFGRAVAGEENSADTVRAFYRFTGSRLKRLGVANLRTDHAGKDLTKGQRGSSAKRDDLDVIWLMRQRPKSSGVDLTCDGSSRLSWVGPHLSVDRVETSGVLSYSAPVRMGWSKPAMDKAHDLDRLGIPAEASRPEARQALLAMGEVPGKNEILSEAIRLRRSGVHKPINHSEGAMNGDRHSRQDKLSEGPRGALITETPPDLPKQRGQLVETGGDLSPSPPPVSPPPIRGGDGDWDHLEEIGKLTGHVLAECPACHQRAMVSILSASGTSRSAKSSGGWPRCKMCPAGSKVEPIGDVGLVLRVRPGYSASERQVKQLQAWAEAVAEDRPPQAAGP
jgi:hypothetical protein